MLKSWWLFVVGLAFLAMPANAETKRLPLGQASTGQVVLYGHQLPDSIFTMEVEMEINGTDTTWTRLLINGYVCAVPKPVNRETTVNNRFELDEHFRQIWQEKVNSLRAPMSRRDFVQFVADQYRASLLVRSTTVEYDSSDACWVVTVCYTGSDDDCEGSRFETGPPIQPRMSSELWRARAEEILTFLRIGQIVFLGNGPMYSPKHQLTQAVLKALEAARQGKAVDRSVIPFNQTLADVQHPPVSLESLRARESGHE